MSVVLGVSSEYFHRYYIMHMPGSIAQAVARLAEKTAVPDSINGPAHTFVEMDHENFLRVLPPLSLIQGQERQLSVTGRSMGTEYCLIADRSRPVQG